MSIQKTATKMHIELIRILCIFCVVFNHTSPTGYLAFIDEKNIILYYLYMVLSVLCKIAVPMFFMISGALLLGKTESISDLLRKRVLKILIVLVLVSIPYYLWLNSSDTWSVMNFFNVIFSGEATTALWYLYSYLGFLLMLPILRKVIKLLKEEDYKYIFCVHLIFFAGISLIKAFVYTDSHVNDSLSFKLFTEFNIFFPIMGYYIENIKKTQSSVKKERIWAIVSSIVAIALTCALTEIYISKQSQITDVSVYETFFNSFIAVPAVGIYFLLKSTVSIKQDTILGKTIVQFGGAVFGVYLIEKILRAMTSPVFSWTSGYLGPFAATVLWVICATVLGLLSVCIIRNLPYVGKVLRKFI